MTRWRDRDAGRNPGRFVDALFVHPSKLVLISLGDGEYYRSLSASPLSFFFDYSTWSIMKLFGIIATILLTAPATVFACEGECIVGITNAFLDRYESGPLDSVWKNIANQLSGVLPNHPSPYTAMSYLQPIFDAYQAQAYDGMETAIFPSYFHGKCLDANGQEPAGCPNPDCPIVCGTPGSLVHFYPHLRYIAYNQTRHFIQKLSSPGSDAYQQVEQNVLNAVQANTPTARMLRVYGRSMPIILELQKRAEDVKDELKMVMNRVDFLLETKCGGTGNGETNGLPDCSWEEAMKQYILTFP
ncbi:hypothetical protein EIP91_000749 [Steccherinum ochraceum]|uniref:Uncharacterized protein n=1 Tax=Steccherinum ochraceum TaxID=92696 RepID=A0A4R0RF58_9APHY|nr:hypothetical protein EIP91_000749 [Steccherinum ochraceum]